MSLLNTEKIAGPAAGYEYVFSPDPTIKIFLACYHLLIIGIKLGFGVSQLCL